MSFRWNGRVHLEGVRAGRERTELRFQGGADRNLGDVPVDRGDRRRLERAARLTPADLNGIAAVTLPLGQPKNVPVQRDVARGLWTCASPNLKLRVPLPVR